MATEKRLIDANALPISKEYCVDEAGFGATFYVVHKDAIDNAPTVDAVEVVHGMWEERRFICMDSEVMLGYRCSKCMLTFDAETNYCPNCGARMDGEDDG